MNPWIQAVLSLVIGLLTATGALLGVRFTVRGNDRATGQRDLASRRETEQRELAARREEWWRRFTWAAELTWDDAEGKQVAGLLLLAKLNESELTGEDERLLLDAFAQRVLDAFEDGGGTVEERSAS